VSVERGVEIEKAAIGAVLLDALRMGPAALERDMRPRDFGNAKCALVWTAILDLLKARKPVDVLTVSDLLAARGETATAGGDAFLEACAGACETIAYGFAYLDMVREASLLRRFRHRCRDVYDEGGAVEGDVATWTDQKLVELRDELHDGAVTQEAPLAVTVDAVVEKLTTATQEKPAWGLGVPWEGLNDLLCGLQPGITMLAGRPSAGKTTVEDIIATYVASQGVAVGRVTLDGTRDELIARALARKAGVSLPKLTGGFARLDQKARVRDEGKVLQGYPMHFDDVRRDLRGICARIREWKHKFDVGLVTLDFIQLVTVEDARMAWKKTDLVGLVSQTLKALSLELRVPFLVLSQLSREVEKENRDPRLSDLRDSGELEQDAHKVIFAYVCGKTRKEMEKSKPGWTKHVRPTYLHVMKNKDGETGAVPMIFRPAYFRFDEAPADFETLMDMHKMPES